MPITFVEQAATIGVTEYSLPNNSTTLTPQTDDCMLQGWINFSAMAAGDTYEIRVLEKVKASDTQGDVVSPVRVSGPQAIPYVFPTLILGNGWDVTVKKIAGTDRSISWSLRKVT